MIEVQIKVDEHGRMSVELTDGIPLFMAIGILEYSKTLLMKNEKPTAPAEDVVTPKEG